LALSSRNRYLAPDERATAPLIHQTLTRVTTELAGGNRDYALLERNATTQLSGAGFNVDYVSIRGARTLDAPAADDRELVALAAARIGRTRLIDNLRVRV
jgi:pantoate--beta-alanine ligase